MTLNRQEMELLIVQRAWKDEAFRDEFIAIPRRRSRSTPTLLPQRDWPYSQGARAA